MTHYPDLSQVSPADHLLFDIGYSWALLSRTAQVLTQIAQCDDYPVDVEELLEAIGDFEVKRLQLRSEIYDNAQAAADKGAIR